MSCDRLCTRSQVGDGWKSRARTIKDHTPLSSPGGSLLLDKISASAHTEKLPVLRLATPSVSTKRRSLLNATTMYDVRSVLIYSMLESNS